MASRRDCLDDIARRTGRPRKDVEDLLDQILDRADKYEQDGAPAGEAYARARDEMLQETSERAAIVKRAEILDAQKLADRHRYYQATEQALRALPVSEKFRKKLATQAAHLAMEAKLVGVNLPFFKGRLSVDAQYVALRRMWVGGLSRDLEQEGLSKIFASRHLEDKWTDELFELNKTASPEWQRAKAAGDAGERDLWELTRRGQGPGTPGITKDAQALAIAKIIQKWQRTGMAAVNREGGWVRSYSGYITRTSHDADAIRAAGPEKWAAETINHLDVRRTFGTNDRQRALDALRELWTPFKDGDHFDYGKPLDETMYPNLAGKASAQRELHIKDGKAWREYNAKYGVSNATHTVVQALSIGARRVALMKEFGTRPAEAFDKDLNFIKATLQQEGKGLTSRLSALEQVAGGPGATADVKAKAETDMAALRQQIADAAGKFDDFQSWEQPLRNRFAQIDGSAQRPVNRALANTVSNWMAVQRMAKLGRVWFTHAASLFTKAMEGRYWGIGIAERYGRLFSGMTQGLEGSAKREALDATLVAFENRLGHMMAMYDVADAPRGYLAQMESTFFKLTGVSSVIDNQRGDAEAMFASHIGGKRGQAWAEIGRKEQRVLAGFGLGEAEWKALHGVEWTTIGDRTYLFPPDALKLSDEQVRGYLKDAKKAGPLQLTDADVAKAREDLATQLAAAYSDRAGYAIPMPSARIRAMLFGKNFETGTGINAALKLLYQFKIWPADMIVRAWGREVYGTIGDGRMDKVAGLVEALVGATIFGVASETVRELIQGRDGIKELRDHPFAAMTKGLQRSGFGTLVGDFLLGEFDRHGFSAVGSLAGPTFSQIDTLMGILHGGGDSLVGTALGIGDQHTGGHPWRARGSDAIKLARDNLPFQNLWFTSQALNTLVWHRLQEWINPGYLARAERRQREKSGVNYIVSPAKTDAWLMGRRASPF